MRSAVALLPGSPPAPESGISLTKKRPAYFNGCRVVGAKSCYRWPMANLTDRLPVNVPGRYYVDSSCIECDQCRASAPEFFARDADTGLSYVSRQPTTSEEIAVVEELMATCATGSIGSDGG